VGNKERCYGGVSNRVYLRERLQDNGRQNDVTEVASSWNPSPQSVTNVCFRKTLVLSRADLLGLLWPWLDIVEALLRVGTLVLLLAAALVELSGVVPVSGLSIQGYEPSALMG